TLDDGFDLIGTAFSDPRFDDGPVERFLREQRVWLESSRTDPDYLSTVAREAALYPDHPVVREVSEESLSRLTGALGRAYKDEMMSRDGVLVTVVGDVDAETLAQQIDRAVSGLVQAGPDIDIAPVEFAEAAASPIIVDLPLAQSLIEFTAPSVAREHPDFLTLQVMNYVFGGGGYNARLNQKLRVEEGLTYGVYSGVYGGQYLRMISGSGQTKNASAGVFIEGIKQQLQTMVDSGVTETELSDVKAYLTGSYALSFDTNAKIAERMMDIRLDGRPPEYFETRNQRINAVTLEDVNRVAAEYMSPERFTFVVVGQPEGLGGSDQLD
ncbi:MAG: M16 family metallopeptidase, partial [Henriciella sp.]